MRIQLVYNENKPKVLSYLEQIKNTETRHEFEFCSLENFSGQLGEIDLIVTVGGDGTALRTVFRIVNEKNRKEELPPVISVDFGRKGFLSTISPDQFYELIEGDINLSEMTKTVRRLGRYTDGHSDLYFLNEVSVLRHVDAQVIDIKLACGKKALTTRADGIIVATETGSSAYAFSAGGPVLIGCDEALVCVFIAPEEKVGPLVAGRLYQPVKVELASKSAGISIDGGAFVSDSTAKFEVSISSRKVEFYGMK